MCWDAVDRSAMTCGYGPSTAAAAIRGSLSLLASHMHTARLTCLLLHVCAHLQGPLVIPQTSQLLPEDLQSGGVLLVVDTLNGKPLQVRRMYCAHVHVSKNRAQPAERSRGMPAEVTLGGD